MHIIAVASGKGGVGKSLLAVNLAVALAQLKRRVVLADLDLGGGNLHLILNHPPLVDGVGSFLRNSAVEMKQILYPTDYPNLLLIPGDLEVVGVANLSTGSKRRLIGRLKKLEETTDYLILDLGSGTSVHTLDFFLLSRKGLIVTLPSVTAITNAYLFLKNALVRLLTYFVKRCSPAFPLLKITDKKGRFEGRSGFLKFLNEVKSLDSDAYSRYQKALSDYAPSLMLNMVSDPQDVEWGSRLCQTTKRHLGLNLAHGGLIYRDSYQRQALKSRIPVVIYKPRSLFSQEVFRTRNRLLEREAASEESIQTEGFLEMDAEAEGDAETQSASLGNLLHCGILTSGEIRETIQLQCYELDQLRKENRFLKHKIAQIGRD